MDGLSDDDHTQYILHSLADAANDFLVASGADTFVKKTLAEVGAILETDLDHGSIQGLTDDDHTQYLLADGTRALTGLWKTGAYGININDADANANMTLGLTINQGANDDEIIALKSSDIAHGRTVLTETDTFAYLKKASATLGGLEIFAVNESSYPAFSFQANAIPDTTKSTAGRGLVDFTGVKGSGTSFTNLDAGSNILAVRGYIGDAVGTKFLVDSSGDTWQTGLDRFSAKPMFMAHLSSNYTLPAVNTYYTMVWQTAVYNVGSDYNSSTGVFTAPVDGVYHFMTLIRWPVYTAGGFAEVNINTGNGHDYHFHDCKWSANSSYETVVLSKIMQLDANDTAYVRVRVGAGTLPAIQSGSSYSKFAGSLLHAI
jgi:hypothetical protein